MGQKNTLFEKQSGEVAENTCLWKKQTGNKPKTKLPILLKILDDKKRTGEKPALM
ncbi:MAG TPA: hypothetical protein VFQ24_08205 [Terriglobia bacterium]|nr:hypothetical protein [Terriglobia bacterium]